MKFPHRQFLHLVAGAAVLPAAKALGPTIPETLLATADQVIE
jgi:hypothetical protein